MNLIQFRPASLILFVLCFSAAAVAQSSVDVRPDNIPGATAALEHLREFTTIHFAPGSYYFSQPIRLPAHLRSVTLEGDHAIISAGQLIQDWKSATLNGRACWVTHLAGVRSGHWDFRELWVNGRRATRCRYPATGYLASVEPPDDKTPWDRGQTSFGYKPGDLPDELPTEAEAILINRWTESRLPVQTVDAANHRVLSTRKTVFGLQDGDSYYMEGAAQWLTEPGEWYLDHGSGDLYYLPRDREKMESAIAVAPTHDQIWEVTGAEHLIIHGLTFSHSEWNLPKPVFTEEPAAGGFAQGEYGLSAALQLNACRDVTIEDCRFEHLGNFGVELGRGCKGNIISRCTFTDMGSGAIKIGETDLRENPVDQVSGNVVSDCRIIDGGKMFPSAAGIWMGQSGDNRIEHNEIADLCQSGVSLGWSWGYGPSLCRGNRIVGNLIHHLGKKSNGDGPISSDMGAIYTLGARDGTVISGNVIHDINAKIYGGWGIYLDEGSSNVLIENNLVYRTTHGAFHLHYGKDNVVQNNIFAFGRDVQIARTQVDPGPNLTVKHNIVLWDSGVMTQTNHDGVAFDENLYCRTGSGKLKFGEESLDAWQNAGEDQHSILADPDFTNPQNGEFSMREDSAALKIHFVPFSTSDAGPRTR